MPDPVSGLRKQIDVPTDLPPAPPTIKLLNREALSIYGLSPEFQPEPESMVYFLV
jgi:hypothetical protein